ncbi:MAG: EAL domain-containing protein [Pseudomonadota bacterium]
MQRIIQRLPISQKLTIFNLILGLTLIGVAGALLFWQNHRMMEHALAQRVAQHGAMVSENLVQPVEFADWTRAASIMDAFNKDPAIARAELRGVSDELIVTYYGTDPVEDLQAQSAMHTQSIAIVDPYGLEIGWLVIYVSREEVEAAAREMLVTITAILTLAVLLGLALGHGSQRMVTKPLANLTDLVKRVREKKDYKLRADPLYPDDLGRLTEDVNAMLEIIHGRDLHLAQTVEVRTRELAEQNTRLESEIRQRERADRLAKSNQVKFEKAFLNAPIGMALVLGDGAVIQRNPMFDSLMDTACEARFNLLTLITGETQDDVREQLQQMVIASIGEFACDAQVRSRDGRELTCALHFSSVREEDDFAYAVLQLQDATESRRLAAELQHQARHDALTGLANRRMFEQTLAELGGEDADNAYPLVIGLIDLDKFKVVNDTAGHAAGDALLQQVASTITQSVRERDLVVRLGGDEFAVICKRCDLETGAQIAEVIRARMEDLVFDWDGQSFRIGASIGIVGVDRPSGPLDDALRRADDACFAAKDGGRNRVCLADDEGDGKPDARAAEIHWAQRLRSALDGDGFALMAQQIMPLRDPTAPRQAEILLRMLDEQGEASVLPGAFLPVAERYGLAADIDRWVVEQLARHIGAVEADARTVEHYWVNLSPATIKDANFGDFMRELHESLDLPNGVINFEIREAFAKRHAGALEKLIETLRPLGCRFALDGFSTSSASLAIAQALDIDMLKLDGASVRDAHENSLDRIVVKSAIDAAGALDVLTCAMFVESSDVLEDMLSLSADMAQGFAIEAPALLLSGPAANPEKQSEGDPSAAA